MLLQEPPPTQFDLHFSLFGIPIRISPWFWVAAVILGFNLCKDEPPLLLLWLVAWFVSILVHELGHALVLQWFGFRPWITLYGMGGLASHDPYRPRRSGHMSAGEEILVSFAGPGAEFLLVAILVGILFAAGYGKAIEFTDPFHLCPDVLLPHNLRLSFLLNKIFFLCVVWGLVNLLPIYPLDGGQIAREIFLRVNRRDGIRQSLFLSIVTAVSFGLYAGAQWRSFFVVLFFGLLAFENYQALKAYSGRGRW